MMILSFILTCVHLCPFQPLSVVDQSVVPFSAAIPQRAQVRWKHSTPMNTVVMFVPQQEAWVVERMGKFSRILEPGLNVLVPVLDKIKYVQSLKEIAIDIPQQSAITIGKMHPTLENIFRLKECGNKKNESPS